MYIKEIELPKNIIFKSANKKSSRKKKRSTGEMKNDKIEQIVEAMQGITYLEWQKLRHVIDRRFSNEASTISNQIKMPSPADIIDSYKHSF